MRKMGTTVKMMAPAAVIVLVSSACATRGFVRAEDAVLDAKVDSLARMVEETQERTIQNAERIDQADQSARAADMAAQRAQAAADSAQMAANGVDGRADQIETALGTLITEVTLNRAESGYGSSQSALPDSARAQLDQLVLQLQRAGRSAFIEIEGHTDNTGAESYNMRLGQQRAEAVKTYLYEQHNVPLHRMNTISYGESRPAAPNNSREGRAQNRRVVVKVRS